MFFNSNTKHYDIPAADYATGSHIHPAIVMVHHALAPDAMAFLDKMITAYGWPAELCHHLVIDDMMPLYYNTFWKIKSIKLVITFGISCEQIGLHVHLANYKLNHLGSFHLYPCDKLEKLAASKELKGKIWNDLKNFIIPIS